MMKETEFFLPTCLVNGKKSSNLITVIKNGGQKDPT